MSATERRYRRIVNLAWVACIIVGPCLFFECGNYYGQVKAYREEHSQELYRIEQESNAYKNAGRETYESVGIYNSLFPTELRELQSSEEIYGTLAFMWVFVTVGVGSARRHAK